MAKDDDKRDRMTLQGVDLEVVRKGAGPPLFLLHGGAGPVAGLPFADRLAERFEVVAPTHPGFGGSREIQRLLGEAKGASA